MCTYFSVLRYIASFNGAELQFCQILIGAHTKLLVDSTKMKLSTLNSLTKLSLAGISEDLHLPVSFFLTDFS